MDIEYYIGKIGNIMGDLGLKRLHYIKKYFDEGNPVVVTDSELVTHRIKSIEEFDDFFKITEKDTDKYIELDGLDYVIYIKNGVGYNIGTDLKFKSDSD